MESEIYAGDKGEKVPEKQDAKKKREEEIEGGFVGLGGRSNYSRIKRKEKV